MAENCGKPKNSGNPLPTLQEIQKTRAEGNAGHLLSAAGIALGGATLILVGGPVNAAGAGLASFTGFALTLQASMGVVGLAWGQKMLRRNVKAARKIQEYLQQKVPYPELASDKVLGPEKAVVPNPLSKEQFRSLTRRIDQAENYLTPGEIRRTTVNLRHRYNTAETRIAQQHEVKTADGLVYNRRPGRMAGISKANSGIRRMLSVGEKIPKDETVEKVGIDQMVTVHRPIQTERGYQGGQQVSHLQPSSGAGRKDRSRYDPREDDRNSGHGR